MKGYLWLPLFLHHTAQGTHQEPLYFFLPGICFSWGTHQEPPALFSVFKVHPSILCRSAQGTSQEPPEPLFVPPSTAICSLSSPGCAFHGVPGKCLNAGVREVHAAWGQGGDYDVPLLGATMI
eukprot:1151773-Pelagomonas_calceolata.AAC.2